MLPKRAAFATSARAYGARHRISISASTASLIENCKLNRVDSHAYLTDAITKIVNGHPNSRIDELLRWDYPAARPLKGVA
jgi:hypothetical protein